MPEQRNSNVELANFGQEFNQSYENVLPHDKYASSKRSFFTCLKTIVNGVVLFALMGVIIFLLSRSNYSKPNSDQKMVNVTDSKLLDEVKQKSLEERQIGTQLLSALDRSSKMLTEMKQNMNQASSMFFQMVHLTQAENSYAKSTFEVNNTKINLIFGDYEECFKKGLCKEGHLLDVAKADNYSSCMEKCQLEELCQWVTFDFQFNYCTMFRDCPEFGFDETRSKCITSKMSCPTEIPCNVTGRCEVCFLLSHFLLSLHLAYLLGSHWNIESHEAKMP